MDACVSALAYVVHARAHSGHMALAPMELEVQPVVSYLLWLLTTESLESSKNNNHS